MKPDHHDMLARAGVRLLLAILLAAPAAAWGEVAMRIEFRLDGPLPELQAAIREGVALQKRINPQVRHELWVDEIHGDHTAHASLIVIYRDLAHHAQAVAREEGDADWQTFIDEFPEETFPATFVGLMDVPIGGDDRATGGNQVLNIFGFELNGDAAGLVDVVREGAQIQQEAGAPVNVRLVFSQIAGNNLGAAILARYESMADFARSTEMLAGHEGWQEFLQRFPADRYTLTYRGLSRSLAIE